MQRTERVENSVEPWRPATTLADWIHQACGDSIADGMRVARLRQRCTCVKRGASIPRREDRQSDYLLVVSGFLALHNQVRSGRRPIIALYVPGDVVSPPRLSTSHHASGIHALTEAQIVTVSGQELTELAGEDPGAASALWIEARREVAIAQAWLTNVGTRDARARLAHLLCEFATRTAPGDDGPERTLDLPFTQQDLGDMLGLTSVHVNRTLRALTGERLISREGSALTITDWEALAAVADFHPAYLAGRRYHPSNPRPHTTQRDRSPLFAARG